MNCVILGLVAKKAAIDSVTIVYCITGSHSRGDGDQDQADRKKRELKERKG